MGKNVLLFPSSQGRITNPSTVNSALTAGQNLGAKGPEKSMQLHIVRACLLLDKEKVHDIQSIWWKAQSNCFMCVDWSHMFHPNRS